MNNPACRTAGSLFFVLILFAGLCRAQEDYTQYFEKANRAFQEGKSQEAIKLYEKVLELNPNFAPAYNALGKVYQEHSEDVEGVAWYFKSALAIDPDFIEANENLGRWYQRSNQPDLAEKYFKKVLDLNPDSISAVYSLGWVYLLGKSDSDQAIYYFERVLEKTPLPMAYYGLGLAYSRAGTHAKVLEIITELKSRGQTDLASKLEGSIRQPWAPSQQTVQVPVSQPSSAIIKAQKAPPPSPPPQGQATIPVRLKGKLFFDNPSAPAGY